MTRTTNKWGETIYKISFKKFNDAENYAKMIGKNFKRFSLMGYHKNGDGWEVVYRPRREYPWGR